MSIRIVSVSGGVQSAVQADRVLQRYGPKGTTLWFADTTVEDEDLYRFLDDLERRWGKRILRRRDGRTPLQVSEEMGFIPTHRKAPCTFALKVDLFVADLKRCPKPVTVYLGMAWWERHRMDTPKSRYEAVPGVTVEYPALWQPMDRRPALDVVRSWGIEPPRAYSLGFSHNNCGGACVKQGHAEWLRLLKWKPELFKHYEDWEQSMRAKGPPLDDHAFCVDRRNGGYRPITLTELRESRAEPPATGEDEADGCIQCSI